MEEENKTETDIEIPLINLDELEAERRANPKAPWKIARQLAMEKRAEFMTREDVIKLIGSAVELRTKAMIAILYSCGCRVEEVVRFTPITYGKTFVRIVKKGRAKNVMFRDYKKKKYGIMKQGILKSDIKFQKEGDREVMIFKLRNLKVKVNREKFTKLVPLTLDNDFNKALAKPIMQYISGLESEQELFDITPRRAEQIINKLGYNPHFFRKLRLTHLVKYHNFSDQKLVAFSGWTDSKPAKHYIKIGWKDLIDSM
jgi:integrase